MGNRRRSASPPPASQPAKCTTATSQGDAPFASSSPPSPPETICEKGKRKGKPKLPPGSGRHPAPGFRTVPDAFLSHRTSRTFSDAPEPATGASDASGVCRIPEHAPAERSPMLSPCSPTVGRRPVSPDGMFRLKGRAVGCRLVVDARPIQDDDLVKSHPCHPEP